MLGTYFYNEHCVLKRKFLEEQGILVDVLLYRERGLQDCELDGTVHYLPKESVNLPPPPLLYGAND